MSFRVVNGNTHTENGWRCCNRDECGIVDIADLFLTETAPLRNGAPLIILGAWLFWYDRNVEEIVSSVWGWSLNNDVLGQPGRNNGSNHLSGTAVDVNAPKYPWGLYRMTDDKIAKVREGLELFQGSIFWGRRWGELGVSKADEMHYQMAWPEGDPRNEAFAEKLRNGYLGIYGTDTGTETPSSPRKPVVPGQGGTFWNDVSQYQVKPIDESYPHKVFSFRTNSGDVTDTLALQNARAAKTLLDSGQLEIVIPYYFFRPGQANCDLHREILETAGLFNHPRTVSMVDVEGDKGSVKGDNSIEINDEVTRMRGWYGSNDRVIGYLNSNADPNLWPTRNGINLVVPQYGRTPGDISSIKDATVRTDAIAHQYTSTATDQSPWIGRSVDANWSPYDLSELLALFGIQKAEGLFMYLTKDEEFAIRDKILGYKSMGNKWPARGIFADSLEGVDDTVGMLLNSDGNIWDVLVILGALSGVSEHISRIERLANGQGPRGKEERFVKIAQELLRFIQAKDEGTEDNA
ncbi:endolysin [Mycobacterium phage Cuke]|uniref:Lysin A n=1 Tax=Mycobacterium phage Cuke TaxID=2079417 RepID=A0A2L1IWT7_9CAUD|nr:endolysin [Mycobacterium phage Cuke]AVD99644.1 lysin A [Mycobacterium phage Cuke]